MNHRRMVMGPVSCHEALIINYQPTLF